MALEHALLVSLSERPGTGIELTCRFDRSIGFFWRATHQQIYKVLRRMGRRLAERRRRRVAENRAALLRESHRPQGARGLGREPRATSCAALRCRSATTGGVS